MNATKILAGRRESALLAFPSVCHMADILAERCREPSWVRTSIATLERFRALTGHSDLEMLLAQALVEPVVAEEALISFAAALANYTESQVSALAMGAKIWFRLNGVAVPWRPLPGVAAPQALSTAQGSERVVLLALIGSGLRLAELLRLRRGDVGSLDAAGRLMPDLEADPLAVQFTPRRGKQVERITFLTYAARQALLAVGTDLSCPPAPHVDTSGPGNALIRAAGHGHDKSVPTRSWEVALDAPLIAQGDDSMMSHASVSRARQRSRALIRAGSDVNVALCRATGDFFREWGLPGSRFNGPEDLNMEEFI